MRARTVIGANFGDEGKGLVVDYLCATQGAGVVVRFNGGAQAGHTVVTPDGKRHVFSHVGSGALCSVPTFLSRFFICNPILFRQELSALGKLGVRPQVYVDPDCLVTTYADMLINQQLERLRCGQRHGSCGVGINETLQRSRISSLRITVRDLWERPERLRSMLVSICDQWARGRCGRSIDEPRMLERFLHDCAEFSVIARPGSLREFRDPIFEGAQGLLLDQGRDEYFPHVTPSNTGMKNARLLFTESGLTEGDVYYVSRTYLTRHGAGPLPGEDPAMLFHDETNQAHPWQGTIRFAPLDHHALTERCAVDYGARNFKLVMTHCDQQIPGIHSDLQSFGPTRADMHVPDRLLGAVAGG